MKAATGTENTGGNPKVSCFCPLFLFLSASFLCALSALTTILPPPPNPHTPTSSLASPVDKA